MQYELAVLYTDGHMILTLGLNICFWSLSVDLLDLLAGLCDILYTDQVLIKLL